MVLSFEFRNSMIIKAVLYKRKSNPFLKESPLPHTHTHTYTHVIHSRGKPNFMSGGYIRSFYNPQGLILYGRGKCSHISKISLFCKNKISLIYGLTKEPKILLELK
jgi:hypothetical protein